MGMKELHTTTLHLVLSQALPFAQPFAAQETVDKTGAAHHPFAGVCHLVGTLPQLCRSHLWTLIAGGVDPGHPRADSRKTESQLEQEQRDMLAQEEKTTQCAEFLGEQNPSDIVVQPS